MMNFVNILPDCSVITNESHIALQLMAVASTMLTIPVAAPRLRQLHAIGKQAPGEDATKVAHLQPVLQNPGDNSSKGKPL
jgi:hypothetical protein